MHYYSGRSAGPATCALSAVDPPPAARRTRRSPAGRVLVDVRVPMRDGVDLSTEVLLPEGAGPFPVVVRRTPYVKAALPGAYDYAAELLRHGYAVVHQDVRGRGDSDGDWEPYASESDDGFDTVEWVAGQPWSDGRVAIAGISYGGYAAWAAAKARPPHLTCIVSVAAVGRWGTEGPFQFGTLMPVWMWWLNHTAGHSSQPMFTDLHVPDWPYLYTHVPIRDIDRALGREGTRWREWLAHPVVDEYWRRFALDDHFPRIDVPALHVTGWFDWDQWGQLHYHRGMVRRSPAADRQWLVVGPWDHSGSWTMPRQTAGHDFGAAAGLEAGRVHRRFLDRWMKDDRSALDEQPRVSYFTTGDDVWRTATAWPPDRVVDVVYHLRSRGGANTGGGNGTLSRTPAAPGEEDDRYVYDPDEPTPCVQDFAAIPYGFEDGLVDVTWLMSRDDLLVYTSDILETPVTATGHPTVVLHAASDCPDTDWHVMLCDVGPDGRSRRLSQGCLRAAFRHGIDRPPVPLSPGVPEQHVVELRAMSHTWSPGHRIRLTVASGAYPWTARNPNTNAPPGDDATVRVATNRVLHRPDGPSRLIMPIEQREAERCVPTS